MKLISIECPKCAASLYIDAEKKNIKCDYCGNIVFIDNAPQYDDAEEAGYRFEKGRQRAAKEESNREYQRQNYSYGNNGYNQQSGNNKSYYNNVNYERGQSYNNVYENPKKRKTWLWVLGWIFCFPIPFTILLLRDTKHSKANRYILIAIVWIFYLIFALISGGDEDSTSSTSSDITSDSKTSSEESDFDNINTLDNFILEHNLILKNFL